MPSVKINFAEAVGKMKPMHAVNNGPVYKFAADQRITNIDAFREAGIPYIRTHDSSFCSAYGGYHTVDVHVIFPDFDADPNDPASYDFPITDEYMRVCDHANTKVFYRLGAKIEHEIKKYGTLPPKDFQKWAVICEHIIRHYTEGWANGFHYDMEYWEIWNEADIDDDDSTHKRCWGGTKAQFFEFYNIAATHLKHCFPHLKIGGPAVTGGKLPWVEEFLANLKAPLDFFSWHKYAKDPAKIISRANEMRELLDRYGYTKTESILDEWNYVRGWLGEDFPYSVRQIKGLKGAAFTASVMSDCQRGSVDMLMYYDARPCAFNGLFRTDLVCDKLKGYYPFLMFNDLYRLKNNVSSASDDATVHVCAAANETEAAVMLTHFNDDDATGPITASVDLSGWGSENGVELTCYVLDGEHDLTPLGSTVYYGDRITPSLPLPNFTSYLLKLKKK